MLVKNNKMKITASKVRQAKIRMKAEKCKLKIRIQMPKRWRQLQSAFNSFHCYFSSVQNIRLYEIQVAKLLSEFKNNKQSKGKQAFLHLFIPIHVQM